MTTTVKVIVAGPVGCGKSAIIQEIVAGLRAVGVEANAIGQTPSDTDGDPIRSLEIYRNGIKVEVSETLMNELMVRDRVGGTYQMADGRSFWIDDAAAREIAQRVLGLSPSSNDRLRT